MQLWLVETRQEMKEMKRTQLWERSTLYSCTHVRTRCTCVRTKGALVSVRTRLYERLMRRTSDELTG